MLLCATLSVALKVSIGSTPLLTHEEKVQWKVHQRRDQQRLFEKFVLDAFTPISSDKRGFF